MANKLEEMFRGYTDTFRSKLQKRSEKLRDVVDELESETEFHQLVVETRSSFSGDYHGKSEGAWQRAVKNFFRRSCYYADVSGGKPRSVGEIFRKYCGAFERREILVSYLAPIEYVYFAERSMDFGLFQIQCFAADELKAIFQNRVNEVFYPRAAIDVKQLQEYWFIYLKVSAVPYET